jgi:hypothetical protein
MAGRAPIAETELDLDGIEGAVKVRVFAPVPDDERDDLFVCRYEISGLDSTGNDRTFGIDSMQAIVAALQIIGVLLYTDPAYKAGRLSRGGDRKLYLPVVPGFENLIPPDYRPFKALVNAEGEERETSVAANTIEDARAKLEARWGAGSVLSIANSPGFAPEDADIA